MPNEGNSPNRRELIKLAGLAVARLVAQTVSAEPALPAPVSLFDGKTLEGWIQIENSATSLSSAGIADPAAFAVWLANGTDAVSVFLRSRLQDSVKADLANFSPAAAKAKAVMDALAKDLNQVISGPTIYDKSRFSGIVLRPETAEQVARLSAQQVARLSAQQVARLSAQQVARLSAQQNPRGPQLSRLNKLLLEDAYPDELVRSTLTGWTVRNGAMVSTGAGRGVIHTTSDYSHFRLIFAMRHVSGNPDHQACVLVFCTRPKPEENPLDALAGIQFQVPNGGHWDYRPGMNNAGGPEFTSVTKTHFDAHEWSRVEILADATAGTARMAVAQPPGNRAVEVLSFNDPAAGRVGPIAWQMHNAGLFDEYKDVTIEVDPKDDTLITSK
jgi:hypothetical protein